MEFIETKVFTKMVTELLSDDDYCKMQNQLVENPACWDIIPGGGGIRKLRFALQGRGKSAGVRTIYYWLKENHQIYMLVIYPKSTKENLTAEEKAILRDLVKEL
jgi:hypothetical protein